MSTNWDLYNTRLNIDGSSERDRIINDFKTMKDSIGVNSPASKIVSMQKADKSAYVDMKVFINSKTNKFEKSISPVMSTDSLILGNKVKWKNADWLITDLNLDDDVFVDGTMRLCNYSLPFQTTSSTIYNEPCIMISQSEYRSGENQGNVITLAENQRVVFIQYNENTKYLVEEKRIFIDQLCDKPKVYKITKGDRISYMNGTNGLLKLTCDVGEVTNADREDLKIADYISTSPTPTPTPTELGLSYITNTKVPPVIYDATNSPKQIKVGGSPVPFDCLFKDNSSNVVNGILPKWDLVLSDDLKNKVIFDTSHQSEFPNRAYVKIIADNSLIGKQFQLSLVDSNNLYGDCILQCQVVPYT